MDRDPTFAKLYYEQIERFVSLGYAKKIDDTNKTTGRVWYVPHFGVTNRNASEYEGEMPAAVKALERKCYMDDYLDSAESREAASTLIQQVTEINRKGGFEMHKWASNDQAVLVTIPKEKRATGSVNLTLDNQTEYSERTLGLKWNPCSDTFTFQIGLEKLPSEIANGSKRPTKREMLRVIMSIFDPLGFLMPFTIRSKILLQDVWRSGIGWDERLHDAEYDSWQRWTGDLAGLKQCLLPRCYIKIGERTARVELHVFCDASEQAYSAVAYWRIECQDGPARVKFVASKSRVAPLKPLSVPRLELQAALLASRLAQTVISEHDERPVTRTFWTDSRTVLSWLWSDPKTYKTFVAHRLGEIDELTNAVEWKWVPTAENPADDATRDVKVKLDYRVRWVQGPPFLKEAPSLWPQQPTTPAQEANTDLELDKKARFVAAQRAESSPYLPDISRFSSWSRLIRSTARVLYFIHICKRGPKTGLTAQHMKRAEQLWVRRTQSDSFGAELDSLNRQEAIDKNSRLLQLSPKFDTEGILRVAGRVDAVTEVAKVTKNPAILDGRHPFTKLLILNQHLTMGHKSNETVVNEIRQRYWVINLRPTVRSVSSRCLVCRHQKAKANIPRMGDLPAERVAHHRRPFTYCGLDYFGPMSVTVGRHHEKRWGVLFTCLTTRAVHLEIAPSLNTDSAILAIRRMTARRGHPTEIYSDNATNFRGADAELKRACEEIDVQKQLEYASNNGIMWKFIPPAAPHMGGSWERMVRCVKIALQATLKEMAPKEETLATFLAEAKHTVNSRPLTHVSMDHCDPEALTPNHFLIGSSAGGAIPGKFDAGDLCSKKQWRVAKTLSNQFWKRWVKEYLPTLVPRSRWNQEVEPLEVGNIVVIVDQNLPRNTWPKGVVAKVYPGQDGRIRVADVRTNRGILTRPTSKIVVLKTDE